jgi:hypothetical protein
MAIVNRKVILNKKLSQAIIDSTYDNKYHENYAALVKKISYQRDFAKYTF